MKQKMDEVDETTAVQKVVHRQGLSTLPPHNIMLSSEAWLDVQWKCLLPAITRYKQSEEITVGKKGLQASQNDGFHDVV